jgi:hypothetical protein
MWEYVSFYRIKAYYRLNNAITSNCVISGIYFPVLHMKTHNNKKKKLHELKFLIVIFKRRVPD